MTKYFNTLVRAASCLIALLWLALPARASDIESRVEHAYADSSGVKIHYATLGDRSKPVLLMIHGFPDYWYTWRRQMEVLSKDYFCVAMDQRGYNLSGQPVGAESYAASLLMGDVAAVIKHLGRDKVTLIGHDWGGLVAWITAMYRPQLVERLIVLNLPHPRGIARELANNPAQQQSTAYARAFQQPGASQQISPADLGRWVQGFSGGAPASSDARAPLASTEPVGPGSRQAQIAEQLAGWVRDPLARPKYIDAFKRSDFAAMLAYYQLNYPREPYQEDKSPVVKLKMPVLMIHGLQDAALRSEALDRSWDWIEQDLTLVTLPQAGHFVQQDAADMVNRSILMWLQR